MVSGNHLSTVMIHHKPLQVMRRFAISLKVISELAQMYVIAAVSAMYQYRIGGYGSSYQYAYVP